MTLLVRRAALVSASLAPVFFIGGTVAAEAMSAGFNPVVQTISELAALDSPVRVFMSVMFVLTSLCHGATAVFAIGIGVPGRIAIGVASVASLGVAIFPLPTMAGSSAEHRTAAIVGFIALAVWPVLGMRLGRHFPAIIRPIGATLGSILLTTLCFWFLAVWASPQLGYVGVVERLAANAESLWPALVVWSLFASQLRMSRSVDARLPIDSTAL